MIGRVKLQMLTIDGRWRTAYCRLSLVYDNIILCRKFGIEVRVS